MADLNRDRIALLIRRWRAFERSHAEIAKQLRLLIQNACEALTTDHDRQRMLAHQTVQRLRDAVSPYTGELGIGEEDGRFLFWGTSMCLFFTAQ